MIKKYVWDTSVFIAVMNNESGVPWDEIELISKQIENEECVFIMPAIVYSEIMHAKFPASAITKLDQFLSRDSVIEANITKDIAKKAAEIRSNMMPRRKVKDYGSTDALVIATALYYQVEVVHSMDHDDMIKFSGQDLVFNQQISLPKAFTSPTAPLPLFEQPHDAS